MAKMYCLLLITITLAGFASGEPHHWAENVCNVSVPVQKDLVVETPVQYEIKYRSMCGILPCVKTRLETRTDQSIKTVVQHINKLTCCKGYAETLNRRCSPICSDPCGPGGKCVEPDICKCQPEPSPSAPGFTGSTCKRFTCLAGNRWGAKCERECQSPCSQNSYCSADTGKCVCNPGWHGANCSLECGPDDDLTSGCDFISQMPPISEPDANLIVASGNNLISSRAQKAEALKLIEGQDSPTADDVDYLNRPEMSSSGPSSDNSRAWAGLASSYLIGILSVMSLILLVAFLIVKKRYEFVRNELYHASVASIGSRSTSSGPGSDYSTSTYYSASGSPSSVSAATIPEKNLEKNLSFAAATRNIISGNLANQADGKRVLLFSPKIESHLIRSQEAAQQNIYSEVDLDKRRPDIANRARAETPTPARKKKEEDDGDHTYQVPKKSPFKDNASPTEHSFVYTLSNVPLLNSNDVSVELGNDNDSNIYEEIKPRRDGNQ